MAELSANAQKILESVEKLTIVELADLVSAMEEKFGVSAAAPVAAAGGAAAAPAEEESSTRTIVLKSAGGNKIAVIKLIREVTGLGLGEAKTLSEAGGTVKENVKKEEAAEIEKKFKEAGATVELK